MVVKYDDLSEAISVLTDGTVIFSRGQLTASIHSELFWASLNVKIHDCPKTDEQSLQIALCLHHENFNPVNLARRSKIEIVQFIGDLQKFLSVGILETFDDGESEINVALMRETPTNSRDMQLATELNSSSGLFWSIAKLSLECEKITPALIAFAEGEAGSVIGLDFYCTEEVGRC